MALGSTFELKTELVVARKLEMGGVNALSTVRALAEEVSKMLSALIQTLVMNRKS